MSTTVDENAAAKLRFPGHRTPGDISEDIRQRVASDPKGALRDARRAYAQAQAEKSAAAKARRRAAAAKFTFEEFKKHLEAMGVQVIMEPGPIERQRRANQQITNAQGGTSDGNIRRNA